MESKYDSVAISKITRIIVQVFQTKASRGSSYIPTPEKYCNQNCGLINIENYDQNCVYYCTKYHTSTKANSCDRLSGFNKLEDKYNYENVQFPASYEDIKTFEENNKIGVIVYGMEENEIVRISW